MALVFGMMFRVAAEERYALLSANIPEEVFAPMAEVATAALPDYEHALHCAGTPAGGTAQGGGAWTRGTAPPPRRAPACGSRVPALWASPPGAFSAAGAGGL